MALPSGFNYVLFEKLWDEASLRQEVTEFFGTFNEDRWNLDADMAATFAEFMKTGRPVEEYYENEEGFIYQSAWNQAMNDERSKYLAMLNYALDHDIVNMLDYGCGIGSGLITFAMSGIEAIGVDICKPNLEFVKQRRERFNVTDRVTVLSGSAKGKWNWRKQHVDMAVCTEVFEHVADPHQLALDLVNVVNPGGALILSWSFVPMVTHIPEHFHLQNTHPDTVATEGFGKFLVEELGLEFKGYSWFNNTIWEKPA